MNNLPAPTNNPIISYECSYDRVYSEIYETSYDTGFVFCDEDEEEEEMLNASAHSKESTH